MFTTDDMELVDKIAIKGPETFRNKLKKLFQEKIRLKKTGRALLECLPENRVVIMPDPKSETCNGSVPTHHSPSGKCQSFTSMAPVFFTPGCTDSRWPDDDALVHELVHAARKSLGIRDCKPLPKGLRRFDDREEFYAILVANIYTSEKQNKQLGALAPMLRRDHRDGRMNVQMAKTFLEDSGIVQLVETFMLSMPGLTSKIVEVKTAFNPIREVYEAARACVAGF